MNNNKRCLRFHPVSGSNLFHDWDVLVYFFRQKFWSDLKPKNTTLCGDVSYSTPCSVSA